MGTIVYVFFLFVWLSVQENIGCQLHGDNDSGDGQVTVFLLSCEGELDVFSFSTLTSGVEMDFRFQLVVGLACLSSSIFAQSRNCIVDQDLDDVQEFSYKLPGVYQTDLLVDQVVKNRAKNNQVNYYTFGKFGESSTWDDTTITAGIYKGDELIYKTEINIDTRTWKNTVLGNHGEERTILSGSIDNNVTMFQAGKTFDLILKVNNVYAMNWIFNSQPLQHDTKSVLVKNSMRHAAFGHEKFARVRNRPAIKAWSKYRSYEATRFVLNATGRAKFDRFVFGQCDAWPKGLAKFNDYCKRVFHWTWARSKANLSENAREDILKHPFTKNLPKGLGVFGNNRIIHAPRCLSEKYFYFFENYVHPDRKLQMKVFNTTTMEWTNNGERAYCCNIDVFSGQILKNDPSRYCYPLGSCRVNLLDEATLKIISEVDPASMVNEIIDELQEANTKDTKPKEKPVEKKRKKEKKRMKVKGGNLVPVMRRIG